MELDEPSEMHKLVPIEGGWTQEEEELIVRQSWYARRAAEVERGEKPKE